jgi:hypothetical protein
MRGCNVDQPRNLAKSVTVEWFFLSFCTYMKKGSYLAAFFI